VGVYSTRDFRLLYQFLGVNSDDFSSQGDALGFRIGAAGDADGDRVPDLLIAAENWNPNFASFGRVDLRSGRTGRILTSYEVRQNYARFLGSLSPLGDLDGDGRDEFLIGAVDYPPITLCGRPGDCSGAVFALRYEEDLPVFIRGDANGDGTVDLSDAVFIGEMLYQGGREGGCRMAMDADGNDRIDLYDSVRIMFHLFLGTLAPAPPFPGCGRFGGLRESSLDCAASPCASGG
jgi:hypothetical protein